METDGRLDALKVMAGKNADQARKDPRPCVVCGSVVRPVSHERCHACDMYWRRNGSERSEILGGLTGADLATWRRDEGLTVTDAAKALGVDRNVIYRSEGPARGKRLSGAACRALARATAG
jgi:hypothetical protein